ncbi:hypothetical protein RHOSPDRAFT_32143 [Rhodotorula sp. JG-1b]|nr:hypothetical protein RHOSPDRAFT_32143 [Rhodotorula sp. JG-1b]
MDRRAQREREKAAAKAASLPGTALGDIKGVKEEADEKQPSDCTGTNATTSAGGADEHDGHKNSDSQFAEYMKEAAKNKGTSHSARSKSPMERRQCLPTLARRTRLSARFKLAWVTDRDWYRETMAEYKLNSKGPFTIDSWSARISHEVETFSGIRHTAVLFWRAWFRRLEPHAVDWNAVRYGFAPRYGAARPPPLEEEKTTIKEEVKEEMDTQRLVKEEQGGGGCGREQQKGKDAVDTV